MPTFGAEVFGQVGRSICLSADGRPEMKAGGVTIDWTTVAAVSGADVTLEDGVIVKIGEKYLRYGQVLAKITASGKYGPYDTAAVDGRATLAPGDVYVCDVTTKSTDRAGDHVRALFGGLVWKGRLLATTGTHSLAAGPTFAELLPVLPRLQLVPD